MPANASHIGEKEMKLEESAYVHVRDHRSYGPLLKL